MTSKRLINLSFIYPASILLTNGFLSRGLLYNKAWPEGAGFCVVVSIWSEFSDDLKPNPIPIPVITINMLNSIGILSIWKSAISAIAVGAREEHHILNIPSNFGGKIATISAGIAKCIWRPKWHFNGHFDCKNLCTYRQKTYIFFSGLRDALFSAMWKSQSETLDVNWQNRNKNNNKVESRQSVKMAD